MGLQKKLLILWRAIAPRKSDQIYFGDRIEQYRQMWQDIAVDINADFKLIDNDIWRLSKSGVSTQICQYQLSLDDPVVLELAARKSAVHGLLSGEGISVPTHVLISPEDIAAGRAFLLRQPDGIVVKPNAGYGGKGVSTYITSERRLKRALLTASLYDRNILLEEQIYGECFRLLVFRGDMISAVRRTGIRVIGDGRSQLSDLMDSMDHRTRNADLEFCLKKLDLKPESVLPENVEVLIRCAGGTWRDGSELRTIYDQDVTEDVCPTIADQACAAARLIGSEFAGVDVITPDIGRPLDETGGVINEVNTTPALHHHYDSTKQRYPRPARRIIEALLSIND
ncbi:MAG: hypothetical protein ACR2PA_13475 [Hyphomicrobiaceae bacterium]